MSDKKDHQHHQQETVNEDNPMGHPEEQPTGTDGTPKFGRLLIVLVLMVMVVGLITVASVEFYS